MKNFFIILVSCFMLGSCTTELDYKGKVTVSRLVVNALLNADSICNYVYVHQVEGAAVKVVTDAEVNVYVNDQYKVKGELVYEQNPDDGEMPAEYYHRYRINTSFTTGDRVRIEAVTPDGAYSAWAEVNVPVSPVLIGVDTVSVYRSGSGSYGYYLKLDITVEDLPGQNDYYRLMVKREGNLFIEEEGFPDLVVEKGLTYRFDHWEDLILNDGKPYNEETQLFEEVFNEYAVFDDVCFKNNRCVISVYIPSDDNFVPYSYDYWSTGVIKKLEHNCTIRLLSINKDDFYYYKALNIYDSDSYEPMLHEPLRFPSNVQGGLGFVGVSKESSYTFDLPDIIYDDF